MPQRLAICIGVNKYKSVASAKLKFACKDAQAIASVLKDPEYGNFDNVVELLDEQATKDNIITKLKEILFAKKTCKKDLILVYFSDHGNIDEGDNFYAVPHDVCFSPDKKVDITSTLHIKDLEQLLDNTKAGNVLFVFDACHSGGSGKLLGNIKYNDNSNIIFVGAARYSELAWEAPEFKHGRFTECLLRSINERPSTGEWITFQQALAFIQPEIRKLDGQQQTMEVSSHTVNQNIYLTKNPLYSLSSNEFTENIKELC